MDHIMAHHDDVVKDCFYACAVCDKDVGSAMQRSNCQGQCLKSGAAWKCSKCDKTFSNYKEKVQHFLKDDIEGNEHNLFRLYLVEPGNTKEILKDDGQDSMVSLKKQKQKIPIKVDEAGNKTARCPICSAPKSKAAVKPTWKFKQEDVLFKKMRRHFETEHESADQLHPYLNESQLRLYEVVDCVNITEERDSQSDTDSL